MGTLHTKMEEYAWNAGFQRKFNKNDKDIDIVGIYYYLNPVII